MLISPYSYHVRTSSPFPLYIGSQWAYYCKTAEQAPGPLIPDGGSHGKSPDMLSSHAHAILTKYLCGK